MSSSVIVDPCNVILHPGTAYNVQYPDTYTTTILNSMVIQTIAAYQEKIGDTLYSRNLTLGASSNVNLEAVNDINSYLLNGNMKYYKSTYNGGVRTDYEFLRVFGSSNASTVQSLSNNLILTASNYVMATNMKFLTNSADGYQHMSTALINGVMCDTKLSTFQDLVVGANATVNSNLLVKQNLIVTGASYFSSNINVWNDISTTSNGKLSRIGYGFNINGSNQLEIIKYSEFYDNTQVGSNVKAAKRIAIFGNQNLGSNDGLDTSGSNYFVFDTLTGVSSSMTNNSDMSLQQITWHKYANSYNIYYGTEQDGFAYVGVGLSNPSAPLHVNGDFICNSNITTATIVGSTASFQTVSTASDERIKNIVDSNISSADCLAKVNDIALCAYTLKSDESDRERMGFIAQQVQQVMPFAVTQQKMLGYDDLNVVDPTIMLSYMIGAIQELTKRLPV